MNAKSSIQSNEEQVAQLERLANDLKIKDELAAKYGQLWDTKQLQQDFSVKGFMAPLVVVERKSDGAKGTMEFIHAPRYYFHLDIVE